MIIKLDPIDEIRLKALKNKKLKYKMDQTYNK